MRGLAVDYSRRGVSALAVALGFVDSERLKVRLGEDLTQRERLVNATAARRIPTVEEVSDLVAVLCSPKAAALTGSVIDMSAGAHLNNLW
jgi:NAD(P)-dependent dehydrogenase (short-subunit alcohol dehydrogenase family)